MEENENIKSSLKFLTNDFDRNLDYGESGYDDKKGCFFVRDEILIPSELLKKENYDGYKDYFDTWKQKKIEDNVDYAKEILYENQQEAEFQQLQVYYNKAQLIPFIGAGLSIESGFPSWKDFILDLSLELSNEQKIEIQKILDSNRYEKALNKVAEKLNTNVFNNKVKLRFNRTLDIKDIKGAVNYLPSIFPNQYVITTNFDHIIKTIYENSNLTFNEIIYGKDIFDIQDELHQNNRILIKIHGNAKKRGRVLLEDEYDNSYSSDLIDIAQDLLFKNSILFMGSSLIADRVLESMKEYKKQKNELPLHFAFMEEKQSQKEKLEFVQHLGDANINPIWYPQGKHDESIEAFLCKLLQESV